MYVCMRAGSEEGRLFSQAIAAATLCRTMTYTTRNTVNRLVRKQLHLNHVVSERTKGGINPCIELEKRKLDQICARNLRTSLDKRITLPK